MILARYKDYYSLQPWYNKEIYIFVKMHKNRHMTNFGTDCTFRNLRTGEEINSWDSNMDRIPEDEAKEILRKHHIDKLMIDE